MSATTTSDAQLQQIAKHVTDLAGPFSDWFMDVQQTAADTAHSAFEQLERPLVVGLALMQRLNDGNPLGWRPVQLAEVLDRLDVDEAGDRGIVGALLVYTRFLQDTGRWLADQGDLLFSVKLLQSEIVEPDAFPALLSAADEAEGLRSVRAVEQVITLIEWVGDKRTTTGTGALKLADVVTVSALLGAPVATSAASRQDDEPVVRSMWQAPDLSLAWVTAQHAGLLEDVAGGVAASASGADVNSSDDELRRQALRQTVSSYVVTMLDASPTDGTEAESSVVAAVVELIGRAVTGQPVTRHEAHAEVGADQSDEVDAEIDSWLTSGLVVESGDVLEVPVAARPGVVAGLLAWGAAPDSFDQPTQA